MLLQYVFISRFNNSRHSRRAEFKSGMNEGVKAYFPAMLGYVLRTIQYVTLRYLQYSDLCTSLRVETLLYSSTVSYGKAVNNQKLPCLPQICATVQYLCTCTVPMVYSLLELLLATTVQLRVERWCRCDRNCITCTYWSSTVLWILSQETINNNFSPWKKISLSFYRLAFSAVLYRSTFVIYSTVLYSISSCDTIITIALCHNWRKD